MKKRLECQRSPYRRPRTPGCYEGGSYPWLRSAERQVWMPGADEDKEEKKDLEYWKQLYPAQVRQIQREVERQCDLLDYGGSVMYDEYPDRIALSRICEAVYQAVMQEQARDAMNEYPVGMPERREESSMLPETDDVMPEEIDTSEDDYLVSEEESCEIPQPMEMGAMEFGGNNRSIQDIIEVLLYNEIHRRRIRRRRGRSWYFG